METRNQIQETKDAITNAVKLEMERLKSDSKSNLSIDVLTGISQSLAKLAGAAQTIPREDEILQRLWYPHIGSRERSVEAAHERTYRWLLYPGDDNCGDAASAVSMSSSWQSSGNRPGPENSDPRESEVEEEGEAEEDPENSENFPHMLLQTQDVSDTESEPSSEATCSTTSTQSRETEQLQRTEYRTKFLEWLRSGGGVFYISGKAGSGKSTLMKYIAHDEKTQHELAQWAQSDDRTLILSSFFFWNSGDLLQKSLEGLYRGILWDILRQCPKMLPQAFPLAWAAGAQGPHSVRQPFDFTELQSAMDRLLDRHELFGGHKICVFIDGLDEYDGDYWKLAKRLRTWTNQSNGLKFCLSSRPNNEFLQHFASDQDRWFQLQDLTRGDMYRFVHSEFEERTRDLQANGLGRFRRFINDIVERSDGVFLWVKLVTASLLKGIGDGCSMSHLRRKLDSAPIGLSGMLRQMMNSIDRDDEVIAARTLLIMQNRQSVPPVHRSVYSHAVLEDLLDKPSLASTLLSGELGRQYSPQQCRALCHTVGARLTARCKGLVEISYQPYERFPFCHQLQYAHRTMNDFLSDPETQDELRRMAKDFCSHEASISALLALVKFVDVGNISCSSSPTHQAQPDAETNWSNHAGLSAIFSAFFQICHSAERVGLPPFSIALKSLLSMCKTRVDASDNGRIVFWKGVYRPIMPYTHVRRDIQVQHIDSAVTRLAIDSGCISNVQDIVTGSPDLLNPSLQGGQDLALAAALRQFSKALHQNQDSGTFSRLFAGVEVDVNHETPAECLIGPFSKRQLLLENPPWTAWCCFLVFLQEAMDPGRGRFQNATASRVAREMIDLFLKRGADPTVQFVGYTIDKGGIERQGPFAMDLDNMMRRWQISPMPSTQRGLNGIARIGRWPSISRATSWLQGLRGAEYSIKQTKAEDLAHRSFKVIKVLPARSITSLAEEQLDATFSSCYKKADQQEHLAIWF